MTTEKVKIGLIGCGNISDTYLKAPQTFKNIEFVACADLDMDRARAQAEKYEVPKACSVTELLADPQIEIVLNLTVPQAHYEIGLAAVEAGKSVYSEKPLALNREQGRRLLDAAHKRGVYIGCAPDTFLGGGLQTCRKMLDDGWIGTPIAGTAFMGARGPEEWHPNPHFFFAQGGGPLFDMGPYYLTALVVLLGPVRRVSALARATWPQRPLMNPERQDMVIPVSVPTHVAGLLEFQSGALVSLVTSFDVIAHQIPPIEIYGSQGSMTLPDPNTFGGPVRLLRADTRQWQETILSHRFTTNSRGVGLSDMAYAIREGRPHRANGELAYHVLDIMESLYESADQARHIEINSTVERPAALPVVQPGARWD